MNVQLSRDDMVALCKERGIKGYSGKKKEDLEKMLEGLKIEGPAQGLKPLVKWSGGKSDELKHIEKYIPKN